MKKSLLFIFVATLLIPIEFANAQIYQEWVANYSSIDSVSADQGNIAIDDSGNVYVLATVENLATGLDYATIKYDKSGVQKWIAFYNNFQFSGKDIATAIVIDKTGNIIVTGMSERTSGSFDVTTIKYNSSGNLEWFKQYNGVDNGNDRAFAIATDNNNNIFIAGHSYNAANNYDYLTLKYSPSGNEEWTKTYNGPANDIDEATAILTDAAGNVYITGSSKGNNSDFDYTTLKYDASGNLIWEARYNNSTNGEDKATALGINSNGDIIVTGMSDGGGSAKDFLTVKYNYNGTQQWESRYDGPVNGEDIATSLAVTQNGKIFVGGKSIGNNGDFDYATISYTTSGQMQWLQRYNGSGSSNDFITDLKIDVGNNVYVTGASIGNTSKFDYTTIKYKQNGQLDWTKRFSSTENSIPNKIALDANENVFVRGVSKDILEKLTTIKYSKVPPGSSCADAVPVLPDNPCIPKEINIAGTGASASTWIKFVPDSSVMSITTDAPLLLADSPMAHVEKIALYEGMCGNLNKLKEEMYSHDNSPNLFEATNLTVGNTYYVEIKKFNSQSCMVCKKEETFRSICIERSFRASSGNPGIFKSAISFTNVCGLDFCQTSIQLHKRPGSPVGIASSTTFSGCAPVGSKILGVYLYFITVGPTPNPVNFSIQDYSSGVIYPVSAYITANGQGTTSSNATCWGTSFNEKTTGYRANLTGIIQYPYGSYSLLNLPYNLVGTNNQTDIDGATLIVIYQNCGEHLKKGTIKIWDGLDVVRGGSALTNKAKINGLPLGILTETEEGFFIIGDVESSANNNKTSYQIGSGASGTVPADFWSCITGTANWNILGNLKFDVSNNKSGGDCFAVCALGVIYNRTLTDCTGPNTPATADAGPDRVVCQSTNGSIYIGTSASSGTGYVWSPTIGLSSPYVAQPTVTFPSNSSCDARVYTLTTYSTSGSGYNCSTTDNVAVTYLPNPPSVSISATPPNWCGNDRTLSANLSSSYCIPLSYQWNTGETTSSIMVPNPANSFTYKVTVTNQCGSQTAQITIPHTTALQYAFPPYVPNASNPGSDVLTSSNTIIPYSTIPSNQVMTIWHIGPNAPPAGVAPAYNATGYQLIVFTRWGNECYNSGPVDAVPPGFTNGVISWNGYANITVYDDGVSAGSLVPFNQYTWQLYLKNCTKSWELVTTQTVYVVF